jgi:hypothetical protein
MLTSLVAVSLALTAKPVQAQTAVSVSAQIGGFHVAVSNYYRVPERDVIVVRDRQIRDDEIPVVFFIAQRAHVAPATVVDLRLRGLSWWDISVRYRLGADVYYVPVAVTPGPPYGKAYGHFKKKPKSQWNTIVLADTDIVNLVQLRFISEHYHVAPERVIEMRARNESFVTVHHEASGRGRPGDHGSAKPSPASNGRGRGRGGR